MDFGKILEEWERQKVSGSPNDARARRRLEQLVDRYAPTEDDVRSEESRESSELAAAHPRNLPIESQLDLHGTTIVEAEQRIDAFLRESRSRGFRKVLIIHGKGHHSKRGGTLPSAVRRYLERHPIAGAMGNPGRDQGGRGALWVIVRPEGHYRSR